MTKKAIVDIDNTLWHFSDAFYEELRKINGNFPIPEHWTGWEIWQGYCTEEEFYGAVHAVHNKQHSDEFLPYPEAESFLRGLKENGFRIIIASHRSPDYRRQTLKWLEKHGLLHDELHLSYHKTRLFDETVNVVVDDSPHVLEKAVKRGVMATGLLCPWNRQHTNNGFMLFDSLNEILEHILNH
jgi:hypothetical protein